MIFMFEVFVAGLVAMWLAESALLLLRVPSCMKCAF